MRRFAHHQMPTAGIAATVGRPLSVLAFSDRAVLCLAALVAACGGDAQDLSAPNVPPSAAFGSSCADLACSFSDSSVDSDGRIATYRWSFGDASPDTTTRDVEHTYTASGSYSVVLTVTDDRGTSASATHVVRAAVPSDVPPVASFGTSCAGLTCSFSDSSSDSDGIIVSRRWIFGDGAEDSAATPAHTYAAAGVYHVQLAVTDDRAATTVASSDIGVRAPVVEGPDIALSAASLGFCYRPASIRNCVLLRRDLSITSVGGKALTWTATSNQPWILVSPASGRTPTTVQVSIDLAKVPPHTYEPGESVRGAITVSGAGAANNPQSVSVTLYFYAVSLPR